LSNLSAHLFSVCFIIVTDVTFNTLDDTLLKTVYGYILVLTVWQRILENYELWKSGDKIRHCCIRTMLAVYSLSLSFSFSLSTLKELNRFQAMAYTCDIIFISMDALTQLYVSLAISRVEFFTSSSFPPPPGLRELYVHRPARVVAINAVTRVHSD